MVFSSIIHSILRRLISDQVIASKKAKTTVYMTEEEEILLNELFIKRLRERRKTDKSALLCEGIRLLFEKEIGSKANG
jgi:hypothetical protein